MSPQALELLFLLTVGAVALWGVALGWLSRREELRRQDYLRSIGIA